jgi:deoxyribodipyrimidine photolyase-related protein
VLLPVDLYHDIQLLKNSKVFLVEEEHYFNRSAKKHGSMRFNILKPVYHRATMRSYYDLLISKKIDCVYIDIKKDWTKIVKSYVDKTETQLNFYDPVDRYVEKIIDSNFESYDIINTPRFILTTEDMETYQGAIRQTSFYGWIRKFKNILMDASDPNNQVPVGGKLTYDIDNRKKPYQGIEDDVDDHNTFTNNKYVVDAFKYVKNTFKNSDFRLWGLGMNDVDNLSDADIILKFPIDRKGSLVRLKHFIKDNLFRFGDYQDVMISDEENSFVFHSALSPMMNVGLLTPSEVVTTVLDCFNDLRQTDQKKKINDVEGFIRQILGWREFTRYMYQHHSDKYLDKNHFNARKRLTNEWYNGTTGIVPIDLCIKKAFRFGYLHHIERLMVISNYMTLAGILPSQMYRWFTEFSLDSYDWVMEYNIYCMASYSDGGQFTSKPYISTSKYILNMSNFAPDHYWTDIWDNMFWSFLNKHKSKIKKIGRLSMLLKYAVKMTKK